MLPGEHRYAWRYLVGFVHPASGRTVWHLATTVNIELFSVDLEAFAQQVEAGPTKQIVLVLDGAGWHTSSRVRVPEHLHLLFLPSHSPELHPAEHLWPLTNMGGGQPPFRQHRECGRCPGGALYGIAWPTGHHPLDDPVPLVAPAHRQAARSTGSQSN